MKDFQCVVQLFESDSSSYVSLKICSEKLIEIITIWTVLYTFRTASIKKDGFWDSFFSFVANLFNIMSVQQGWNKLLYDYGNSVQAFSIFLPKEFFLSTVSTFKQASVFHTATHRKAKDLKERVNEIFFLPLLAKMSNSLFSVLQWQK